MGQRSSDCESDQEDMETSDVAPDEGEREGGEGITDESATAVETVTVHQAATQTLDFLEPFLEELHSEHLLSKVQNGSFSAFRCTLLLFLIIFRQEVKICHSLGGVLGSNSAFQCQCLTYKSSSCAEIEHLFIYRLLCLLGDPLITHNLSKTTPSSKPTHQQNRKLAERTMVD